MYSFLGLMRPYHCVSFMPW